MRKVTLGVKLPAVDKKELGESKKEFREKKAGTTKRDR